MESNKVTTKSPASFKKLLAILAWLILTWILPLEFSAIWRRLTPKVLILKANFILPPLTFDWGSTLANKFSSVKSVVTPLARSIGLAVFRWESLTWISALPFPICNVKCGISMELPSNNKVACKFSIGLRFARPKEAILTSIFPLTWGNALKGIASLPNK